MKKERVMTALQKSSFHLRELINGAKDKFFFRTVFPSRIVYSYTRLLLLPELEQKRIVDRPRPGGRPDWPEIKIKRPRGQHQGEWRYDLEESYRLRSSQDEMRWKSCELSMEELWAPPPG